MDWRSILTTQAEIMRVNEESSSISHAEQHAKLTDQIKNGFKHGGEYGYVKAEMLRLKC